MIPAVPRNGGQVVELVAPERIVVTDRPVAEPLPGEVRVRLRAVGICGTDIHGYLGRIDAFPMTLGHDAAGVVDAIGPDTPTDLVVGTRVTIDPALACGGCASCRAGLPQVCTRGSYLGMTAPGTMADHLTVPANQVIPLPDEVEDVAATVLEPVAVALHLLDRIGAFDPPERAARVIGAGPLGVLLAQTLESAGWHVAIHEPQPSRRRIAADCGLTVADDRTAVPDGPILLVETSAAAGGIELARSLATPGSVVALVGRAPADFTSAEILLKELSVLGIRAGTGLYPAAIALVASGAVTPLATVSHRFTLDAAADAFAAVTDPAQRVMRAVLLAGADRPSTEGQHHDH